MIAASGDVRSSASPDFPHLLRRSYRLHGSALCLGIDPVPEYLPDSLSGSDGDRVVTYFTEILEIANRRRTVPGAFKPNIGFFHAMDRPRSGEFSGSRALASLLDLIRHEFPAVPIILDAKRADIARSSTNYGREAFRCWQVDAVTVSPYMGEDSVLAVVAEAQAVGGLVYTLLATSNPGASQFQSLALSGGGAVSEAVADAIVEWHRQSGACGAVVGATRPEELGSTLSRLSEADVPVLIPGVGHQGGTVEAVADSASSVGYPLSLARVNVSSAIAHPWRAAGAPENWREVVARSLETFWRGLQ